MDNLQASVETLLFRCLQNSGGSADATALVTEALEVRVYVGKRPDNRMIDGQAKKGSSEDRIGACRENFDVRLRGHARIRRDRKAHPKALGSPDPIALH